MKYSQISNETMFRYATADIKADRRVANRRINVGPPAIDQEGNIIKIGHYELVGDKKYSIRDRPQGCLTVAYKTQINGLWEYAKPYDELNVEDERPVRA